MAAGDPFRDEVATERRRAVAIAFVGAVAVLVVLAAGGAVAWTPAAISVIALAALITVYLSAARQTDRFRARRVEEARAKKTAGEGPEALARAMLEAMPDPVLLVRPSGRVEAANAAARRAYPAAAGGDVIFSKLVREPEVLAAVVEAIRNGRAAEVEFKETGGDERFLRAFAAPFDAGEAGRRALVVVRDDSAVKHSELARADFLANASHELRTPLASLTGYIETLRGHARDDVDARNRFLEIMGVQAERMRRLIDDLLSLSRIEQTEHVPPQGSVDLVRLAGDVVDAMAPMIEDKGVTVELLRADPSARVVGDRDELTQVVQNLIENAVKYSQKDGVVRVEVGCGPDAASAAFAAPALASDSGRLSLLQGAPGRRGRVAWLRVTDEGPGIARRHLPRLSERFFRAEAASRGLVEGTGLGLAIVKHILTRHRGGLTVESALATGSRFSVILPLVEDSSAGEGA